MADGERAALARGDHQVLVAGKDDAERECARQPLQRAAHGLDRAQALVHQVGDEVDDGLGVGVALELVALGGELFLQLAEVLDDAVVDDRDLRAHVRVRVAPCRTAVRRPARVADAGAPAQRLASQPRLEVAQLAFGATAAEAAVVDRGDAGGIIAAILEPAQRVDEIVRDGLLAEDADNSTHGS